MKFLIIGAGSWGCALAQVLSDNNHDVVVYARDEHICEEINKKHTNIKYFDNNTILNNSIKSCCSFDKNVFKDKIIIFAVPSKNLKSVCTQILPFLDDKYLFINTAKGFDGNKRMSEIIKENIPKKFIDDVISLIGPSHAEEVMVKDLTCVSAVCKNTDIAFKIANLFSNNYFRVYVSSDEIGSEIAAAMKNVVAICSGILEGLNYGDNARAALCTRGLNEIIKLVTFFGGSYKTMLGLTGIGDLVVTCYSSHSRNFVAGLEIGKNDSAKEFIKNNTKTVEGIGTCKIIYDIAVKNNIDLPIIACLYRILYEDKIPSVELKSLMSRPLKEENLQ